LHLSNVGAAVTDQDKNGGIAGVVRVGAADVVRNCNEGVSGDNTLHHYC